MSIEQPPNVWIVGLAPTGGCIGWAKKVLRIEDEPSIIEAISFILKRDGWVVVGGAERHGDTAADAPATKCFADAGVEGWRGLEFQYSRGVVGMGG